MTRVIRPVFRVFVSARAFRSRAFLFHVYGIAVECSSRIIIIFSVDIPTNLTTVQVSFCR